MKKREPYYNKASKNTLLGIVSTGLSVVLTAIIMPLIVVRFGTENWGRYSFFLLYVAVMAFVESALQIYSLQRTATATTTMNAHHWMRDKQVFLLFVGLLFISGLVISFNKTHGLTQDVTLNHMLMLVFVNVFPRGVTSIIKGKMLGLNSQGRYYAISTLLNVSRPFLILLAMLLFKPTILMLVVLYVIFSFVEMTTYLMFDTSRRSPPQLSPTTPHKVDNNLLISLLILTILSVLSTNMDKILMFNSVNLKLAGEYTLASTVAGLLYFFINVASSAFAPKFKELFLHDQHQTLRSNIYGLSFINNLVVMFAISAFYFTGDYLLQAMSSNLDRNNVMNTFLLLATACLLSSNLWIPGIVAVSMGQASFPVKTNLLFVGSYFAIFHGITFQSGPHAFAQSMLLAAVVTTTVGMGYFKLSIFRINIVHYVLMLVALPLTMVGILIVPLWGLDAQFKSLWVNLFYLAVIGAVCIGIWCRASDSLRLRLRALLENL